VGRKPDGTDGAGEGRDSPELILREVALGGARFERLVLTRNRRVMASVADRGRTLRLHESFRSAPADTLHAVGRLFSRASPAVRRGARNAVREYLTRAIDPADLPSRPRRPAAVPPTDGPLLERLAAEFARVNVAHFDAALPAVPIRISDRMRRRLGHFCADPLEIAISRTLCDRGVAGDLEETLRHEMIHLWQWHTGTRVGHGPDFRRLARKLGITPRATRAVEWSGTEGFAWRRKPR
jgi:hypothetical protein